VGSDLRTSGVFDVSGTFTLNNGVTLRSGAGTWTLQQTAGGNPPSISLASALPVGQTAEWQLAGTRIQRNTFGEQLLIPTGLTVSGAGSFALNGGTLVNNGRISAGTASAPGQISIGGNFLLGANSVLAFDLGNPTAGNNPDNIFVSGSIAGTQGSFGALELARGTLTAAVNPGGDVYRLINAGSGMNSATFTNVNLARTSNTTPTYTNSQFSINAVPLRLSVTPDALGKVFGGADPVLTYLVSGFVAGDTPSTALTGTISRAAGENVGNYNYTLGTLFSPLGYALSLTGANVFSITPAQVNLSIIGLTGTRVYDGTNLVAASVLSLSGLLPNQDLTLTGAGLMADPNVGVNKAFDIGTLTLGNGTNGLASNYTLVGGARTVTITPASLGLQGLLAQNKVYDANTSAVLSSGLTGVFAGDNVSAAVTGSFLDRNVGNNKTINYSAGLTGAQAGNYVFLPAFASGSTTANITPASLSLAGLQAQNKVYDANTSVVLSSGLTGVFAGDNVSAAVSGSFLDKNVGNNKTINYSANLTGAQAGNYVLLPAFASGTTAANITPFTLGVSGLTAASKVYDGSLAASLSGTAVINAIAGDQVALSGTPTGTFASRDAGTARPIAVTGLSLTGADARNYLLGTVSGLTAAITPATLTLTATPATAAQNAVFPTFTGSVSGFVGGDSQQSATTGALVWSTPASPTSPAGVYAINGGGLVAANYRFVQAPGNASALNLTPAPSRTPPLASTATQTLLTTAAVSTSLPVVMSTPSSSRVLDSTPGLSSQGGVGFASLNLSQMSRSEVITLLAARDNYKKNLFAEALHKLKIDPALADVRPCANEAELSKGQCLITESLKRAILQAREINAVQRDKFRKVKQAAVPAIERKVALLIGINDYVDRRIPFLMGAIPDARAVRTLLEDRLGYETILVENSSKETMLAALNKLALESGPNDSVMVYFAGHGEVVPSTGMGYWLPSDSRIDKPESWISNTNIARLISLIGAKQMMLISDSCYSGTLAGNEKVELPGQRTTEDLLSRKAVVILSSGGNEPVADEGKNGHSVFAYHLMNALRELGDWKAGSDVFERLRDAVRRDFPQTPQYGASREAGHQGNTDYLLERREIEKAAQ
jgi:hypothetical protein